MNLRIEFRLQNDKTLGISHFLYGILLFKPLKNNLGNFIDIFLLCSTKLVTLYFHKMSPLFL